MTPRLRSALPLLSLLLLVADLGLQPMQETDLFFRLASGEQILRDGWPSLRNQRSFTFPDHPYLDSAWWFDAGAALLVRAGGLLAAVVGKTLVLLATFAGAFGLCRRRGAGAIASAVALGAAALVMQERLVERPHVFSFAGLVLLLLLLESARERPSRLWLALPLTAAWTNLHAGSFVAPLVLGAWSVAELTTGQRATATRGTLVALGAAAAMLVSPAGFGVFRYLTVHPTITDLHAVDEFRRPALLDDWPLLLYIGLAAALTVVTWRRCRPRATEVGPTLVLVMLTGAAVRFGADLALVLAPIVALRVGVLVSAWGTSRVERALATAALAGMTGLALLPRAQRALEGAPVLPLDLPPDLLPLPALRFVAEHGLDRRMYNDFELGGYLAWRGKPVFVDPRLPAYPVAFHTLLGRTDLTADAWDRALAEHDVDAALLAFAGVNRRGAWFAPTKWALVYRAHDARVFVRRTGRWRSFIAAHELPATITWSEQAGARVVPLAEPPPSSPVPRCEWLLRLGDLYFDLDSDLDAPGAAPTTRALEATEAGLALAEDCLEPARLAHAAAWVGGERLRRGQPAEALAALDRALGITPKDSASLTNRALALEALAQPAGEAWARVAEVEGDSPLGQRARAHARAAEAGRNQPADASR